MHFIVVSWHSVPYFTTLHFVDAGYFGVKGQGHKSQKTLPAWVFVFL